MHKVQNRIHFGFLSAVVLWRTERDQTQRRFEGVTESRTQSGDILALIIWQDSAHATGCWIVIIMAQQCAIWRFPKSLLYIGFHRIPWIANSKDSFNKLCFLGSFSHQQNGSLSNETIWSSFEHTTVCCLLFWSVDNWTPLPSRTNTRDLQLFS